MEEVSSDLMGLIISQSPPLCTRRQASAESPGRGVEWGPGRDGEGGGYALPTYTLMDFERAHLVFVLADV